MKCRPLHLFIHFLSLFRRSFFNQSIFISNGFIFVSLAHHHHHDHLFRLVDFWPMVQLSSVSLSICIDFFSRRITSKWLSILPLTQTPSLSCFISITFYSLLPSFTPHYLTLLFLLVLFTDRKCFGTVKQGCTDISILSFFLFLANIEHPDCFDISDFFSSSYYYHNRSNVLYAITQSHALHLTFTTLKDRS